MQFKVIQDKVLIQVAQKPETSGLIYIPEIHRPAPVIGTVIAVGDDVKYLHQSDTIQFPLGVGVYISISGISYIIVSEPKIIDRCVIIESCTTHTNQADSESAEQAEYTLISNRQFN